MRISEVNQKGNAANIDEIIRALDEFVGQHDWNHDDLEGALTAYRQYVMYPEWGMPALEDGRGSE